MSEPAAAQAHCDHNYETRLLGGHPITVRACLLCRTPDWNDLAEQANIIYRWGREEALAGKPPRDHLSAYDMPREQPDASLTIAAAPTADDYEQQRQRADRAEAPDPRTLNGPTVAECAADDRNWDLEKTGE